jgi:hypothetical protein
MGRMPEFGMLASAVGVAANVDEMVVPQNAVDEDCCHHLIPEQLAPTRSDGSRAGRTARPHTSRVCHFQASVVSEADQSSKEPLNVLPLHHDDRRGSSEGCGGHSSSIRQLA